MGLIDDINGLKVNAPIEPDLPPAKKIYDWPRSHIHCLQEPRHGNHYCIEHNVYLSVKGMQEQENGK